MRGKLSLICNNDLKRWNRGAMLRRGDAKEELPGKGGVGKGVR